MTDRPILFSAPMVRAILAGRKTQTRRLAKFVTPASPGSFNLHGNGGGMAGCLPHQVEIWGPDYAPIAAGDRLWVKETWLTTPCYDDLPPSAMSGDEPLYYVADEATYNWAEADGYRLGKTRVSIHMPRWASRLTLTVTDVRVERLQAICETDAEAEGIYWETHLGWTVDGEVGNSEEPSIEFCRLWDSINGKTKGATWADNPWVVAYTFTVEKRNIDA